MKQTENLKKSKTSKKSETSKKTKTSKKSESLKKSESSKQPQNFMQIIADASKIPNYSPAAIKRLMQTLDLNEKSFAFLMNVSPQTIRLWMTGAAKPSNIARRLIQLYETAPELIVKTISTDSTKGDDAE